MLTVSFDTETHLIRRGKQAPEFVCLSLAVPNGGPVVPELHVGPAALACFRDLLLYPEVRLVGHNVAFDLAVLAAADPTLLPLIFQALAADRITDTMLREKLLRLSRGELKAGKLKLDHGTVSAYSLAGCAHTHLAVDRSADKVGDVWRYSYDKLDGVALDLWPQAAADYARQDAADTLLVYLAQETSAHVLRDQYHQTRKAFAIRLMESWGVRTNAERVESARLQATAIVEAAEAKLRIAGLVRADGTTDLAAVRARVTAAYKAQGLEVPLTDGGTTGNRQPKTDGETLRESGDPVLEIISESAEAKDFLSDWLPRLLMGARSPLHARYDTILETGRTSCTPNLQNPPRGGAIPVRECFEPRPGYLYASNDYNQLELCSLAQACLWICGFSDMATAIRKGIDLHTKLAADMSGVRYEDYKARVEAGEPEAKKGRQFAKAPNFGYPGGMGPNGLVKYAKSNYGLRISLGEARIAKSAWHSSWSEMRHYFNAIRDLFRGSETASVTQFGNGRVRGRCFYTEACNTFFQGLATDGAGQALFDVAEECYARPGSALYGSRPVMFLHDEIIAELPAGHASEAANRLSEVMNSAMRKWIPDVPISSSPALMRRWYKKAEAVHDPSGRLIPWEPKEKG